MHMYLEAEHQCNNTKWPEAAQEGEDRKIEIITRRIWPMVAFWVDKAIYIISIPCKKCIRKYFLQCVTYLLPF